MLVAQSVELLTIEEVYVSETLLVAGSNPVKHPNGLTSVILSM